MKREGWFRYVQQSNLPSMLELVSVGMHWTGRQTVCCAGCRGAFSWLFASRAGKDVKSVRATCSKLNLKSESDLRLSVETMFVIIGSLLNARSCSPSTLVLRRSECAD